MTRTGTESQKRSSWRVINWRGKGENGRLKMQGIRIKIGRHKIDRGRLRIE